MRLRKNYPVTFGASLARACAALVCQPLPLARHEASTSGSRRKVTGILCTACTGRPVARRATICSGVLTRPSPTLASCKPRSMDRNNASSNSRISGSALGVNFLFDIKFFHQDAQLVIAPYLGNENHEFGTFDNGQYRFFVHRINGIVGVNAPDTVLAGGGPQDGDFYEGPLCVRRPSTQEPDWAVTSINLDLYELLNRATAP